MKKLLSSIIFLASMLSAAAQLADADKQLAESMEVGAGGTFGKAKIVPKLTKLALAQVSVDFKTVSSKSSTAREHKAGVFGKQLGSAATATVTAYLNITDDDLTDADYRSITDHFYDYFQKALKQNGFDTVAWSTITATDFYKDGKEEKADDKEEKENGQTFVSCNAYGGTTMFNGKNFWGGGKAKRAGNFCDAIGSPAAFINTTVDFADILADADIKTTGYQSSWTPSYNDVGRTTKAKSHTSVAAFMKIPENSGLSLFTNEKMQAEILQNTKPLAAEMNYADNIAEDPSLIKKKSKMFSVSLSKKMESAPVIISTTKAQYIAAAEKALEKYADAFIAKAKAMKKS